jgi:ABC-type Zn uptake system ZnuABC Zn-binding protein ZnuA
MKKANCLIILIIVLFAMQITACVPQTSPKAGLKVVASTTIVGDVVKQIGGDRISLTVLLPVGADPHTFEPRPQDAVAISDASIIFLNGLELEHSLQPVISTNAKGAIVAVSTGINVLPFNETKMSANSPTVAPGINQAVGDPHTWMDPNLVIIWVNNINSALAKADPANTQYYDQNSKSYIGKLMDLDQWVRTEVATIPEGQRKLVTDHESFGYFAHRYGFEIVGLVVASLSTNASPSAQELAALEDTIRKQSVHAIFVDSTVNPALSQQVAQDTGVRIITIHNGSLGNEKSGFNTYLDFMRFNVQAIVDGLK